MKRQSFRNNQLSSLLKMSSMVFPCQIQAGQALGFPPSFSSFFKCSPQTFYLRGHKFSSNCIGLQPLSYKGFHLDCSALSPKLYLMAAEGEIFRIGSKQFCLGFHISSDLGRGIWLNLPKFFEFQSALHLTPHGWSLKIGAQEMKKDLTGLYQYAQSSALAQDGGDLAQAAKAADGEGQGAEDNASQVTAASSNQTIPTTHEVAQIARAVGLQNEGPLRFMLDKSLFDNSLLLESEKFITERWEEAEKEELFYREDKTQKLEHLELHSKQKVSEKVNTRLFEVACEILGNTEESAESPVCTLTIEDEVFEKPQERMGLFEFKRTLEEQASASRAIPAEGNRSQETSGGSEFESKADTSESSAKLRFTDWKLNRFEALDESQSTTITQPVDNQKAITKPSDRVVPGVSSAFPFFTAKGFQGFEIQGLETEILGELEAQEASEVVEKIDKNYRKIVRETGETRLYLFGSEIFSSLKMLMNNFSYSALCKNEEEVKSMRMNTLSLLGSKMSERLMELNQSPQGIAFFNWFQESIEMLFQLKTLKSPSPNEEDCENTYPQLKSTQLQKSLDFFIALFFEHSGENTVFESLKELFKEDDELKKQTFFNNLHSDLLGAAANLDQQTFDSTLSAFLPQLQKNLFRCQSEFAIYVDQDNTSHKLGVALRRKAELVKIKELSTLRGQVSNGFALEVAKNGSEITNQYQQKRLENMKLNLRNIELESETIANEIQKSLQTLPRNEEHSKGLTQKDSESALQSNDNSELFEFFFGENPEKSALESLKAAEKVAQDKASAEDNALQGTAANPSQTAPTTHEVAQIARAVDLQEAFFQFNEKGIKAWSKKQIAKSSEENKVAAARIQNEFDKKAFKNQEINQKIAEIRLHEFASLLSAEFHMLLNVGELGNASHYETPDEKEAAKINVLALLDLKFEEHVAALAKRKSKNLPELFEWLKSSVDLVLSYALNLQAPLKEVRPEDNITPCIYPHIQNLGLQNALDFFIFSAFSTEENLSQKLEKLNAALERGPVEKQIYFSKLHDQLVELFSVKITEVKYKTCVNIFRESLKQNYLKINQFFKILTLKKGILSAAKQASFQRTVLQCSQASLSSQNRQSMSLFTKDNFVNASHPQPPLQLDDEDKAMFQDLLDKERK